MSKQIYIRDAQQSNINGVELYRRRFYLSRAALDEIDNTSAKLGISPSEYIASLAEKAASKHS